MKKERKTVLLQKIEKGLKNKKMTQKELARILGVHQMTVNKWFTGNFTPTIENLTRIDKELGLGLSVAELFDYALKRPKKTKKAD